MMLLDTLSLCPAGKRDALLREETDGAGGLQPRPRLAGLLANHIQPGSDASREGNGSMQRSGESQAGQSINQLIHHGQLQLKT